MSTTSYYIESKLDTRACRTGQTGGMPAGVKKSVKKLLNRGTRLAGKQALLGEVALLDQTALKTASLDELDAWADAFLAADLPSVPATVVWEPTLAEQAAEFLDRDDRYFRIPSELEGSLPDWMLDNLESAHGHALDHLSMFEVKQPRAALAYSEEFEE